MRVLGPLQDGPHRPIVRIETGIAAHGELDAGAGTRHIVEIPARSRRRLECRNGAAHACGAVSERDAEGAGLWRAPGMLLGMPCRFPAQTATSPVMFQ